MSRIAHRHVAASIALLAGVAAAKPARADARDVAERVVEQWRGAGGHVTALPTRFLFDDETVVIPAYQYGWR